MVIDDVGEIEMDTDEVEQLRRSQREETERLREQLDRDLDNLLLEDE